MAKKKTDSVALWQLITQAGGIPAYIEAQLRERGLFVERKETEGMPDKDKDAYKKSLRAEAAERRKLQKETWRAYRSTHIVHVGEGIFWNDAPRQDRWDLPNAEERAAENELPPLDTPQQLAEALGLTVAQDRWRAYHRDAATHLHYRRFVIA